MLHLTFTFDMSWHDHNMGTRVIIHQSITLFQLFKNQKLGIRLSHLKRRPNSSQCSIGSQKKSSVHRKVDFGDKQMRKNIENDSAYKVS